VLAECFSEPGIVPLTCQQRSVGRFSRELWLLLTCPSLSRLAGLFIRSLPRLTQQATPLIAPRNGRALGRRGASSAARSQRALEHRARRRGGRARGIGWQGQRRHDSWKDVHRHPATRAVPPPTVTHTHPFALRVLSGGKMLIVWAVTGVGAFAAVGIVVEECQVSAIIPGGPLDKDFRGVVVQAGDAQRPSQWMQQVDASV